jgi:hypothetical protein
MGYGVTNGGIGDLELFRDLRRFLALFGLAYDFAFNIWREILMTNNI